MATIYNRFNVNILCIADSADATDLQSKVLQALSSVPEAHCQDDEPGPLGRRGYGEGESIRRRRERACGDHDFHE